MWAMRWRVPWRRFHFSSVPQKLKDSYKAQVEAGGLEKDGLQERVVGYLSQALEKALQREQHQPSNTRDGSGQELGFAGHPGWVLPLETIGGSSGSGAAEEHRRAAEWTAKLAAENRRRLAKGTQAKVLPAATGISQVETQRTAEPASEAQEAPPKREPLKSSVYLHGPVGTGKTMLMNLFHDHSQQAGLRTSRQHFYEFMISLHQQIQKDAAERPVEVAANRWADDLDVLCFDEFQITDIQDAVILPRLFEVLFLRGVTVVMTSNTAPQLLYTGGLNRHVHLPAFVRLVAEHSTVLGLGAKSVDYRRRAEANMESDFDAFLVGDLGAELFESKWRECVGQAPVESVTLTLPMGRYLDVPQVAGSACRLGFQELCAGDRGEADFYALADRFQTVFLSGVPKFTSLEDTDVVRRFVKLLDLLYDRRIKVVLSSAVPLEELFDAIRDEVKGDMSDLAWRTAQYSADGKAGLSPQAVGTLCEAIRAGERAESRLREMRTRQYWQSCE